MLFYTRIKREFTPSNWKDGQHLFRDDRIADVKLKGELVTAKIRDTADDAILSASIKISRGMIQRANCNCPPAGTPAAKKLCSHVAGLAIWIVERGSLLRAGIGGSEHGVSEDQPEEEEKEAPAIIGEAVLFVQGLFQSSLLSSGMTRADGTAIRTLNGIAVESAVRYRDPDTGNLKIATVSSLTRQLEPGVFRVSSDVRLRVPTAVRMPSAPEPAQEDEASSLLRLTHNRVIYQGQAALEQLVRLLQHRHRSMIVFDPSVSAELDPQPLKLVALNIGRKVGKTRVLSYVFENPTARLTSDDLGELARQGRLTNHFAWKGERIYRFEPSLLHLHQYANRSGIAAAESAEGPLAVSGYGALFDDSSAPLHPLAAYRLSLELGVKNFQVDEDWKEFHEWRVNFEKKKLPSLPKVDYGFDLRTYQENGLSWLWSLYHRGLSGLLADEMGLGKTHQVLAFLSSIYRSKNFRPQRPSLVVAPTSVIAAWMQKLKKYDSGLNWVVFHGRDRTLPDGEVDLVLTTYGILHREPALREREWHVVILDEAQAIKNAGTISSRASRVMRSNFRIAMTGTPVENQSSDLWSLMEFLLPGYLGSLPRFKRLYGSGREAPTDNQAAALRRLVSPFLLRRTKSTVLKELPEKIEEILQCEMTAAQRKAYRACLSSADANRARENLKSEGKIDYANILALLTRLKQICDHPRLADITVGKVKKLGSIDPFESGKWEMLDELLQEALGSGLKVVIFTQYLGMMDMVAHFLKEKSVGHTDLRGDTPDRAARIDRFQTDPECKVFICSLLAGGLGIDLTAASVCIHFDRWWNPAKENQATDRLHRFGQTRGVQVFKLQMTGTVEDRIASIIESKVALSGTLIEESSAGLKAFSRRDLLELLTPDLPDEP